MEPFESLCNLVREGLEAGAYPSAAVAAGVGDRVYVRRCYGQCTEETLFDMASVSKVLSATMVAFHFLAAGKLSLDDTLDSFFPDVPAEKKKITVRHLMTHTSGIPAFFMLCKVIDNPEDAVQAILQRPLVQKPGEGPVYSCMGYILLGKILERIGAAPLDVLAQNYVFGPLGMDHTTYHPTGDIAPTELDAETQKLLQGVVHDENARFLHGISGNAGVFSNLGDMILFAQMLARGGAFPDGSPFLDPAVFSAATQNYTPGPDREFRGLGFHLAGSPDNFLGTHMSARAFGHTGFTGTSIAIDPETKLWVVLLTNRVCPSRENLQLIPLRRKIHNAAADAAARL